jgi:hypothetical protein
MSQVIPNAKLVDDIDDAIKRLQSIKRRLIQASVGFSPTPVGDGTHRCAGTELVPHFCAFCGRSL